MEGSGPQRVCQKRGKLTDYAEVSQILAGIADSGEAYDGHFVAKMPHIHFAFRV
jgi:hypothetical protein